MYSLNDPLTKIPGIGPKTSRQLSRHGLHNILDLLLFIPLRYEDKSKMVDINQLRVGKVQTVKAKVVAVKEHFKGKLRITSALIRDETGDVKCMWFNNRFIKQNLKKEREYFFAGKFSKYHNLTQPAVEAVSSEAIHTGRLVPIYSETLKIKQGYLRRWQKTAIDNLKLESDYLAEKHQLLSLSKSLKQIHFPEETDLVIKARERLAVEEFLSLMQQSQEIKQKWTQNTPQAQLPSTLTATANHDFSSLIPNTVPFDLTNDQKKAIKEIITDLTQDAPMNRLLIGDVGSGKTVVAGVAIWQLYQKGYNTALIAPTQILAEQHQATFAKLFPEISTKLLTAKTAKTAKAAGADSSNKHKCTKLKKKDQLHSNHSNKNSSPTLYIGTHAVINQLEKIKPALVVYDEQHRFGVTQRAQATLQKHTKQPHVLTMSATPIPRSYMLTIFAHLNISLIQELPFGPKPIKTWYVSNKKKKGAYQWLIQQLLKEKNQLALIVCPFVETSKQPELENIPAAKTHYQKLKKHWGSKLKIELLHGQQKSKTQEKVISKLFAGEVDLLVATTIIEVGVDLPQANIMIIEGADRFGLASLHQLRGRVGRQGQKSYCLLYSDSQSQSSRKRLSVFSQETDGLKLAELDLENRGPGDLLGTQQHGLADLRFASWGNAELIIKTQKIFEQLQKLSADSTLSAQWRPLFAHGKTDKKTSSLVAQN